MKVFAVALGLGMTVAGLGAAQAQDADKGAQVFKKCAVCHTIEQGGANKVGPNLHGVVGRKAGSVEGFNYSTAMKNANITWTPEELDKYLTDPKAAIPGNKMAFPGLKKDDERAAVIGYLQENSK
jgi:cytochrome c